MIKLNWLFLFLLVSLTTTAQFQQTNRYEVLLGDEQAEFELIPCGETGLILWKNTALPERRDSTLLQLTALDTTLQVRWQKQFLIHTGLSYIAAQSAYGKTYLLYGNYTTKTRNLIVFEIDVKNGTVREHGIKNIIPFSFFGMEVIDNGVLIGGYFNYRPLVILYNFTERIPRILPGLFNDRSELVQLTINQEGSIDVILAGHNQDRVNTLFINTFDTQGRLLKMVELKASKKNALLFGRSRKLNGPSQLVAGVYGHRNSEYSRGVFIANINEYGEQNIKYYNYGEFKNFFSYLKARREERIKRRIERKRIKNKKLRFHYRLLVHDLIEHEGQFILLGEAFYPKYKTVQGSPGIFNSVWSVNRGLFSYNRVFEGYQYTHAIVIGFDARGNVLWDNSFEIKDVLSPQLKQYVHASTSGDNINMVYVVDNAIRSKVVNEGEVIEGKELIDVKLKFEGDQVREEDTEIGGLEKWYGNHFVTYGWQTIRNAGQPGVGLTRDVFFINKVRSK